MKKMDDIPTGESFTKLMDQLQGFNYSDNILTSFGGGFLSIVAGLIIVMVRNKICQKSNCELDSGCLKINNRHIREDSLIKGETLREIIVEHTNKKDLNESQI